VKDIGQNRDWRHRCTGILRLRSWQQHIAVFQFFVSLEDCNIPALFHLVPKWTKVAGYIQVWYKPTSVHVPNVRVLASCVAMDQVKKKKEATNPMTGANLFHFFNLFRSFLGTYWAPATTETPAAITKASSWTTLRLHPQ
jgi:hypothetical protein